MKKGTISMSDKDIELWTLTNQFRWFETEVQLEGDSYRVYKVLQQMSQGSKGSEKWEDVPTVTK